MSPLGPTHRLVLQLSCSPKQAALPAFCRILGETSTRLCRLSQSSLGGVSITSAVVETEDPALLRARLASLGDDGELAFTILSAHDGSDEQAERCGVCVTLLGELANPEALGEVAGRFGKYALVLDAVHSLGKTAVRGAELIASRARALGGAEFGELRAELLALGPDLGLDLAVQRDDFYRRNRRLLCMDVDSTFVKGEFIDELAELGGVKSQVAEITARAMRGELDFSSALRERVQLLAGLPMSRVRELCARFELNPGAEELVRTVKQLGMRVGLVSGGFDFFVEMLKERFGLDFAFANTLEIQDDRLTGRVTGSIVDGERKAQLLRDMTHVFGFRLEQTIAVGDGANDIQMLKTAGLGIAYQAKPRLREVADTRFDRSERLDTLLYLMGFDAPEAVRVCAGALLP